MKNKRIVLYALIAIALLCGIGSVNAEIVESQHDNTIVYVIPENEVATDGTWTKGDALHVRLRPGVFDDDGYFQKVIFVYKGYTVAVLSACWYKDGSATWSDGGQIFYCYEIYDGSTDTQTSVLKEGHAKEGSNNTAWFAINPAKQINVNAEVSAWSYSDNDDDEVKFRNIKLNLKLKETGGKLPVYSRNTLDTLIESHNLQEIPYYIDPAQVEKKSNWQWKFNGEMRTRPGLFGSYQKVKFFLNDKEVAAFDGCSAYANNAVNSYSDKIQFCYQIYDASTGVMTSRGSTPTTNFRVKPDIAVWDAHTGWHDIEPGQTINVYAKIDAWDGGDNPADEIKFKNIELSSLPDPQTTCSGGTCTVTEEAVDPTPTGTMVREGVYDRCKFGEGDVFGKLTGSDNKPVSVTPVFKVGSGDDAISVFNMPDQVCLMIKPADKTRLWSNSETTAGLSYNVCYSGTKPNAAVMGDDLKAGITAFHGTFPPGVVGKYLESIYTRDEAYRKFHGDDAKYTGFKGSAIEMQSFIYNFKYQGNYEDIKLTALHEFTHNMDYHNCFIFGDTDKLEAGEKWTCTGSKAEEFSKLNAAGNNSAYLGENWKNASDKEGFIPVEVSKYAQSNAAEDFAETSAFLLADNSDTEKIVAKALKDEKLKQKILLIVDMWKTASDGKMDEEWWCTNIQKFKGMPICVLEKPTNLLKGLSTINKNFAQGILGGSN
ncbi:MAG: hypothetical protein JW772_01810 [Candidatus Diapherotrites archaeon]|nr:hypothetical protein [Candidatus Diapherotrites archaeon]